MPFATTPYNFVPLAKKVHEGQQPPDADRFHGDRHTGWFDLEISTLTPTYIREARRVEDSEEGEPSGFFWGIRNDKIVPLIPGSSLRGVVRSLFEILTCSRMDFISSRRLFYRSFASTVRNFADHYQDEYHRDRLVAGVLVREGQDWYLHVSDESTTKAATTTAPPVGGPVNQHHGFLLVERSDPGLSTVPDASGTVHWDLARTNRTVNEVFDYKVQRTGDDANLGISPHSTSVEKAAVTSSGDLEGWLVAPGKDIQPRHYYHVILKPQQSSRKYRVSHDVMEDYLSWGQMAHGARFGTKRAPRKLKEEEPAFAILNENLKEVDVIGANLMMPLRYGKSITDVASQTQDDGSTDLDMAQAVFGRVTDERDRGNPSDGQQPQKGDFAIVKSRVFVGDAVCTEDDPWLKGGLQVKVPDVLSGPKPTAFQTYLQQGSDPRNQNLWDSRGAQLRGRKHYWHRSSAAANSTLHDYPPSGASDTQITRITPVRENVVFRGRIRFENLSNEELGALYASIQLPEGLAHKIGMGKNLGLGSARLRITKTTLLNMPARFCSLDEHAGEWPDADVEVKLCRAYQDFLNSIEEYQQAQSLWTSDWTRALASLLSWDSKPADEQTCQIGVRGPGSEQWRYRYPLPEAVNVIKVQAADVFPSDGAVSAQPHRAPAQSPPRASRQPPASQSRERSEPRPDRARANREPAPLQPSEAPIARPPRHLGPAIPGSPPPQQSRPAEQDRPTDAPKPTLNSKPTTPSYREGDRITCKVIALTGTSATVELPDMSRLSGVSLYLVKVGDTVKLKVLDVGRDGTVKKLIR